MPTTSGCAPWSGARPWSRFLKSFRERPTSLNQQTWNRRYRDYMDKIKTGSLFRVAEVLRDLTLLSWRESSFGGRRILDTAKNLLVKELCLVNNKEEDEIEAQLQELLGLEIEAQAS